MESVITQKEPMPVCRRVTVLFTAAAVTLAVVFGVNILHLLDGAITGVVHISTYTMMIYNAAVVVIFSAFIPCLNIFLKRQTDFAPFAKSEKPLSYKRTLIIFAITAVCIFVTSACIGFKFKVFYELGQDVAVIHMSAVLIEYVRRLLQLMIAIAFLRITDEAFSALFPASKIPVAGILFVLLYGVIDFFLYRALGRGLFSYVYLAYNVVYALFYYIGDRKLYTAFIPATVLLVL